MRIYEKGRQLGLAESKWVRVEVELLAKTTTLGLGSMLDAEALFAGAYSFCAGLVSAGLMRPERVRRAAVVSVGHVIEVARQQVGATVGFLTGRAGWSAVEVVRFLRRLPSPRISGDVVDPEWLSLCRVARVEYEPEGFSA